MASVPPRPVAARPTNLAPLARLLSYAQALGLERHLRRPKRGVPTLALALLWLVLAWRASGRIPVFFRRTSAIGSLRN